jgi:hypothetical protein
MPRHDRPEEVRDRQQRAGPADELLRHAGATSRGGLLSPAYQRRTDLLWIDGAESFQPGAKEIVMAKGQMRSNKEKKKPKADKNLKKGGVAPVNPFAAGKTPAGQSPNSKKS